MFTQVNQNKIYLNLLNQFRVEYLKTIDEEKTDFPVTFVLNHWDKSSESCPTFATLITAESFRVDRKEGLPITVNSHCNYYQDRFQEHGIILDLLTLQKYLIQIELETTIYPLSEDRQIEKYPHLSTYIHELFNKNKTRLHSRFRRITEEAEGEQCQNQDFIHAEGDLVTLTEDYRIIRHIKTGGEKVVYEVEQQSTHQPLALKELRSSNAQNLFARSNITGEAVLQAHLTHPNIPTIFSLKTYESECPVFVERMINGTNWETLMPELSFEENISILLKVARVISYAHDKHHIIHADLKPENIMLGESVEKYNEIYVTDWGFAVRLDKEQIDNNVYRGGTMTHIPPEGVWDPSVPVTAATDVFMLGGILYQILTGRAPYEEVYYMEGLIIASEYAAEARISEIPAENPQYDIVNPPELIQIAVKALSKYPADRYQSASEFADSIQSYLKQAELSSRLINASNKTRQLRSLLSADQKSGNLTWSSSCLMEQIETTNELRLIRQSAAANTIIHKIPEQKTADNLSSSSLLNRAIEAETDARDLLLRSAIASRDYSLAAIQLKLANELAETYPTNNKNTEKDLCSLSQYEIQIRNGLALQRRYRLMKWLFASALVFICIISTLVFYQRARNIAARAKIALQEKENKILQILPLQQGADRAKQESYGPAMLQYYNAIRQITPDNQELAGKMESIRQNYLFPQKTVVSPNSHKRKTNINQILFSESGDLFALLSGTNGEIWLWDTITMKIIGRMKFSPRAGVSYKLYTNPLFDSETDIEKRNCRPFILVSSSGFAAFVGHDQYRGTDEDSEIFDLLEGKEQTTDPIGEDLPRIMKMKINKNILIRSEIRNPQIDFLDIPDRKSPHSWQEFLKNKKFNLCLKTLKIPADWNTHAKVETGKTLSALNPAGHLRIDLQNDTISQTNLVTGQKINQSLLLNDPFQTQRKAVFQQKANRVIVWDGQLRAVNPETLETELVFEDANEPCQEIISQENGTSFAVAFESGDLAVYDALHKKPLKRFRSCFPYYSKIILGNDSQDNRFLATTTETKKFLCFDWKISTQSEPVSKLLEKKPALSAWIHMLPNNILLVGCYTGGIYKIDFEKGTVVQKVFFKKSSNQYIYSPSRIFSINSQNSILIVGSDDGALSFIDVEDLTIKDSISPMISRPLSGLSYQNRIKDTPADTSFLSGAATQKYIPDYSSSAVCAVSTGPGFIAARFVNGKIIYYSIKLNNTCSAFFESPLSLNAAFSPGTVLLVHDSVLTMDGKGTLCRWNHEDPKITPLLSLNKNGDDPWNSDHKEAIKYHSHKYGVKKILKLQGARDCGILAANWNNYQGTGISSIPDTPPVIFWKEYVAPSPEDQFFTVLHVENKEKNGYDKFQIKDICDIGTWSSPKGELFFILLDEKGQLKLYNQKDGKASDTSLFNQELKKVVRFVQFVVIPDQSGLIALAVDGSVYHLDLKNSTPKLKLIFEGLRQHKNIQIAVSPDSRQLAVVNTDGRLRFWDLTTEKEKVCTDNAWLTGPKSGLNFGKIRYNSNGRTLFQSGENNTISVWDTETLQERQRINVETNPLYISMNNAMDGLSSFEYTSSSGEISEILVCGGADGALYFYREMSVKNSKLREYHLAFLISSKAMNTHAFSCAVVDILADKENNRLYVGSLNSLHMFDLNEIIRRMEETTNSVTMNNIDRITELSFTSDQNITNSTFPVFDKVKEPLSTERGTGGRASH